MEPSTVRPLEPIRKPRYPTASSGHGNAATHPGASLCVAQTRTSLLSGFRRGT